MDDIDKKILNILQENDKTQYQRIAKQLDLGASTVHYRIKKLIKNGIITNFSAIIDPEKVGYATSAVIGLNVDPLKMHDISQQLTIHDEVQLVTTSSGDHDIILNILSKDGKHLWRFINEHIKPIDGVEKKIHVSTYLDIYKRTNMINLKTDGEAITDQDPE
jgi:Lrp/AsnC family transcriptional regulator, regulator for asnA, asnC and gidA